MTLYANTPHTTLRQGDVILAPSALLLASVDAPAARTSPEPPMRLGDTVLTRAWSTPTRAWPPELVVQAQYSPVLVLSHDCELEKDFNERVRELIAAGTAEADAVAQAEADPTLDPFAVIAPLLPYASFPAKGHPGMRAGQRIGIYPLDDLPGDGGDYVVDLFRPATVSVRLLPHAAKVASLAEEAVFDLRYKLSEAYASRDLAVLTEIEAIVGHTIVQVEALPKTKKKTALLLHLDTGETVHLEIRSPRDALPAEITRSGGAAP